VNTKADETGWYDVLDPISLTETCLSPKCDDPLQYNLKIQTINGFINTECTHLSGECTLLVKSGSVQDLNYELNRVQVRPSCEAPGAKVTYVYDITASVSKDTD
jgi:hypothetical protein